MEPKESGRKKKGRGWWGKQWKRRKGIRGEGEEEEEEREQTGWGRGGGGGGGGGGGVSWIG